MLTKPVLALPLTDGSSGQKKGLQRAHQPDQVVRMEAICRLRINVLKPAMQEAFSFLLFLFLKTRPEGGVSRRSGKQATSEHAQIESSPADHQHSFIASENGVNDV